MEPLLCKFRRDLKDNYLNYPLREARLKNGYTIKELEEITGINSITFHSYERCRAFPPKKTATIICKALCQKVAKIFPNQLRKTTIDIERERKNNSCTPPMPKFISLQCNARDEYAECIKKEREEIQYSEPQSTQPSPYEQAIYNSMRERLRKLLKTIPSQEAEIIRLRFGIDNMEHTLEEIAKRYHTTKQTIYNIEQKAICKLRHPRRLCCLADYFY